MFGPAYIAGRSHLKFDLCDDIFVKCGGRALSSLISKYNVNKKSNYDIFTIFHLFFYMLVKSVALTN